MRPLLVSIIVAGLLSLGQGPSLEASEQWCSSDPVVAIVTPNGSVVPIFVSVSALGRVHRAALELAQIRYQTAPAGSGTAVTMQVEVPNDHFGRAFRTASLASLGPYGTKTVLARAGGSSSQPMELSFTLAVR